MEQGESAGRVFDEMGEYWAEIADKDQTIRQINFIETQLKPDRRVLDLACGTGRHSIELTKSGYSMVGLDASRELLKIAKQRYSGFDAVLGDMRFLPFRAEAFGAVVSMDTSFGYLPSLEDDLKCLAGIRRVLPRGGVLVIDVFNRETLKAKYQGNPRISKWLDYPSFRLQQQRSLDPDGACLHDRWTIQPKSGGETAIFEHSVRLYSKEELQGLLQKGGFQIRSVLGDYECQEYNVEAPRLIAVANAN